MTWLLAAFGCATPEQVAQRQAAEQERHRQGEAAYNAALRQQCESIGYTPQTDPWRQCLLQLHTANQQQDAAARAAILQELVRQQAQQPRPTYQPVPRPRTPTYTNCQRDAWGNLNCYTY